MDIIVGVCKHNFGIGKDNYLPWHFKKDLQYFSKITRGTGSNAIIMGRKTWESLSKKPLTREIIIYYQKLLTEIMYFRH